MASIRKKVTDRSIDRQILSNRQGGPINNLLRKSEEVYDSSNIVSRGVKSSLNVHNKVSSLPHNVVDTVLSNDIVSTITTSNLNKLWRMKILQNRSSWGNGGKPSDTTSDKYKVADNQNQHVAKIESLSQSESNSEFQVARRTYMKSGNDIREDKKFITRAPLDRSNKPQNDIIIINPGIPYTAIVIQNRPNILNITPTSNWASIKSMGRNNPFMMYTGGEDSISFDISWYCSDPKNREEVVTKCRLLESWTRADGYSLAPPTLKIIWGNSNIFENDDFILESAPYQLTHFQDASFKDYSSENREIQDLKLYPNYATQTLTFKRVTWDNRTRNQIISIDKLKKTSGITFNENSGETLNM